MKKALQLAALALLAASCALYDSGGSRSDPDATVALARVGLLEDRVQMLSANLEEVRSSVDQVSADLRRLEQQAAEPNEPANPNAVDELAGRVERAQEQILSVSHLQAVLAEKIKERLSTLDSWTTSQTLATQAIADRVERLERRVR